MTSQRKYLLSKNRISVNENKVVSMIFDWVTFKQIKTKYCANIFIISLLVHKMENFLKKKKLKFKLLSPLIAHFQAKI